jgi:hypothetical protein
VRTVAAMTTTTLHRMQDERLAGGLAVLITTAALAFANFGGGDGDDGGAGPFALTAGVCAIVAAVLFARVLPRADNPGRAAWILAALAIVTCVVFWSGLPIVLGLGAAYSGMRAGRPLVAGIGALAAVLAAVACVIG